MTEAVHQKYADLSKAIYDPQKETRRREDSAPIGNHRYRVLKVHANPKTGYYGAAFQDVETNEIIIAHRGTEHPKEDVRDMLADANMAMRQMNSQAEDAVALTKMVIQQQKQQHTTREFRTPATLSAVR